MTVTLEMLPQFDRQRHGSLFDRGSADSWYSRERDPHWYPEGTGFSPRMTTLSKEEIAEYNAGYDYNEEFGGKKDYD
jgi:hypothetical protein